MPEPTPDKLPRGPHAMTREDVAQAQRERLLTAMIDCVAAQGYVQTSVADVLARSGISRATFYQLFADKEDCFRAAYQRAAEQLAAGMAASLPAPEGVADTPLRRLERILGRYLDSLAGQPALARTFLIEVHAAGPRLTAQRQASIEGFIDLVASTLRGQAGLLGPAPEQRFAVTLLVHGVISLVTGMIATGNAARLPELRQPLLRLAEKLVGAAG